MVSTSVASFTSCLESTISKSCPNRRMLRTLKLGSENSHFWTPMVASRSLLETRGVNLQCTGELRTHCSSTSGRYTDANSEIRGRDGADLIRWCLNLVKEKVTGLAVNI